MAISWISKTYNYNKRSTNAHKTITMIHHTRKLHKFYMFRSGDAIFRECKTKTHNNAGITTIETLKRKTWSCKPRIWREMKMQARVQGFVYALLALPACRHPDGSMFDPKGFRPCDVHDVFLVGRCPVRSSNVDLANSCFTFQHFIIVIPELLCYACRPWRCHLRAETCTNYRIILCAVLL